MPFWQNILGNKMKSSRIRAATPVCRKFNNFNQLRVLHQGRKQYFKLANTIRTAPKMRSKFLAQLLTQNSIEVLKIEIHYKIHLQHNSHINTTSRVFTAREALLSSKIEKQGLHKNRMNQLRLQAPVSCKRIRVKRLYNNCKVRRTSSTCQRTLR